MGKTRQNTINWLLFLLPVSLLWSGVKITLFSFPVNLTILISLFTILLATTSWHKLETRLFALPKGVRASLILLLIGAILGIIYAPSGFTHRAFIDAIAYIIIPGTLMLVAVLDQSHDQALAKGIILFTFVLFLKTLYKPFLEPEIFYTLFIPSLLFTLVWTTQKLAHTEPKRIKHSAFWRYTLNRVAIALFIAEIILTPVLSNQGDATHQARTQIFGVELYLIRIHPVTGIGLTGLARQYKENINDLYPNAALPTLPPERQEPINLLLAFWLNLGLPGLIGLGGLLFYSLRHLFRFKQTEIDSLLMPAGIALFALVLMSLWGNAFFKYELAYLFWFYLALILNCVHGKDA